MERYERTPGEERLVVRLRGVLTHGNPSPAEVEDLATEIVDRIGSPDSELRDALGYTALARWILDDELVSSGLMKRLLARSLGSDGMMFQIGETDTDSVFRRSFSVLVVALVLAADNERCFLSADDFDSIVSATASFGAREADFRAEVPGRGWAHAVAHLADLVDECGRSRFSARGSALVLAVALGELVDRCDRVFEGEEDERIATALVTLARLEPSTPYASWIGEGREREGPVRINWKNVARSVFFRSEDPLHDPDAPLLVRIQQTHTLESTAEP